MNFMEKIKFLVLAYLIWAVAITASIPLNLGVYKFKSLSDSFYFEKSEVADSFTYSANKIVFPGFLKFPDLPDLKVGRVVFMYILPILLSVFGFLVFLLITRDRR